MMRNLLIVDDEELIRQGLKARIRYFGLSIDDVYEASSGIEALEIIKEHPVNIVITDIRMPDMDGLTFIKEAKNFRKHMQFIVLSGYAEFSYAEEAIRLGVKVYLLKPISNEELKNTLIKIFKEMEIENKNKRIFRMEKEKAEYLLEKEMNSVFSVSEEKIMDIADLCQLAGKSSLACKKEELKLYFSVMSIHTYGRVETGEVFLKKDKDLIRFSVKNIFSWIETDCGKLIVNSLTDSNYLYAIYWAGDESKLKEEVKTCFEKIKDILEKKMGISITQGVSKISKNIQGKIMDEALKALNQRIIYGDFNVYFYEDIEEKADYPNVKSQIHALRKYLERKEGHKIQSILGEIFCEERAKTYGSSYIKTMWIGIMNMLFLFYDGKAKRPLHLDDLFFDFQVPNKAKSMVELQKKMGDILLDCLKTESISQISSRDRIQLAMRYISDHYNEDISINDLADHYEMSPNYFSSIFKQETGQSAINYITEIRMKKAKEFLQTTGDSVVDIAKRVGYEDSQYFFRVFKKYVGITPLKYREEFQ